MFVEFPFFLCLISISSDRVCRVRGGGEKKSELWRRHRRKVFVSLGVVGGGYALYKLYSAHRDRYLELEVVRERQQVAEEIIKNQLRSSIFDC